MNRIITAAIVALVVAGCSKPGALGPPEIHLNQDTCHACGMTVSDERHAAAVVFRHDGVEESFVFDDTGELLDFQPPANATDVTRFVHDFASGQWINAADARFDKSREHHTPMGTGVVAYRKTAEGARS
jgi:nitrous oxide reductase accessory protein NosL